MATLEKISAFAGKTFTVWVLIFAVIAYFFAPAFCVDRELYRTVIGNCHVWDGADA